MFRPVAVAAFGAVYDLTVGHQNYLDRCTGENTCKPPEFPAQSHNQSLQSLG